MTTTNTPKWAMPEEAVIAARMAAGKHNFAISQEAMTDIVSAAMAHVFLVEDAPAMTNETVKVDTHAQAIGLLSRNMDIIGRDLYYSGFWGRLRWLFRGSTGR